MNSQSEQDWTPVQGSKLHGCFQQLTPKQHEVLRFVAENRTSKEIAWELGISESAVNQRIEGVRSRAGAPPRAALARAYRQYIQRFETDAGASASTFAQSGEGAAAAPQPEDEPGGGMPLPGVRAAATAPQLRDGDGRTLVFRDDRINRRPGRIATVVAVGASVTLVMMVGLGIMLAIRYII